jgi:uncharacterized repeat protein (TIGR01451 family)
MKRLVLAALLIGTLVPPAAAHATFPGQNGKIAFVRAGDIWTMDPDGLNQVNVTNDAPVQRSPSWSADGNRITFDQLDTGATNRKTWTMLANGSNRAIADDGSACCVVRIEPAWSPSGTRLVFSNGEAMFSMNLDGTSIFGLVFGGQSENPDWSPAGDRIAFQSVLGNGCHQPEIWVIKTDGTAAADLTPQGGGGCDAADTTPSWSPDAQRIAYYEESNLTTAKTLFTIKPDGTDRQPVPGGGPSPVYSPDATKFAYQATDGIHTMTSVGTGDVLLAAGTEPAWQPLPGAGPSADVLAGLADAPDPVRGGDELHYTATAANFVGPAAATGVTLTVNLPPSAFYVSATPTQGSCSQSAGVVTCNLGTLAKGASASVDVDVEPFNTNANYTISASAHVSANETDFVQGNNSAATTTTVVPGAYPRPMGATPVRASLVPAYRSCGSEATLQHGSPLSYPSCGNPQLSSGPLTVGSTDSSFIGSVRYTAIGEASPVNPNNGDQADIGMDVSLVDIRKKSDLSDYTGQLQVHAGVRITDHDNGAGGFTPATVQDGSLDFTVPCAATASDTTGGSCVLHTTADTVVPGTVKELKRMVWQLGQVQVRDGGPDGVVSTADNTLFAVEGVFVP